MNQTWPTDQAFGANPEPTHYETVSDRVDWCPTVLLSDDLPDQNSCS